MEIEFTQLEEILLVLFVVMAFISVVLLFWNWIDKQIKK
jgi:hypothetical protein